MPSQSPYVHSLTAVRRPGFCEKVPYIRVLLYVRSVFKPSFAKSYSVTMFMKFVACVRTYVRTHTCTYVHVYLRMFPCFDVLCVHMYIQYVRMYVRTYIRKCSMCVFECMYIRTYVFLHSITLSCFRIEYVQQCVNSVRPSQPRQRVYIVHFQVC